MPTSPDLLIQQNPTWDDTIPGLTEIHHATWAPHHILGGGWGGPRDGKRKEGDEEKRREEDQKVAGRR